MRLFIAIEVPEELKDYIKILQDKLKTGFVRATYPKEYHITLLFIGEVAESSLSEIRARLKEVKFNKLNLALTDIGTFPNINYIRVVWLGIKEEGKLSKLAEDISVALDKKPDKRFHSHLTLARIKNIVDTGAFKEVIVNIKTEFKVFEADSFKLIKSTLEKEGPVYEVLEEFKCVE